MITKQLTQDEIMSLIDDTIKLLDQAYEFDDVEAYEAAAGTLGKLTHLYYLTTKIKKDLQNWYTTQNGS